jgi:hypothetical protein
VMTDSGGSRPTARYTAGTSRLTAGQSVRTARPTRNQSPRTTASNANCFPVSALSFFLIQNVAVSSRLVFSLSDDLVKTLGQTDGGVFLVLQ